MPRPQPLLFDFRHVTVYRGNREVLHRLNLRVHPGEHVALLGPNGCGKSTLIKTIARELYPLPGGRGCRCRILGRDEWDLNELRGTLGLVAADQLQQLSHEVTTRVVTGRELVLSGFFGSIGLWPHHRVTRRQEHHAAEVLEFLEIAHLARRSVAEMSSGEQRRALIGRALVHEPATLILDEPTNSLDPGAVREFRALLRKLARAGRSLILVTHHVSDLIPEIDRVILMRDGRIVADGPKARLLTSRRLSALFGARLRLLRQGDDYDLVSA